MRAAIRKLPKGNDALTASYDQALNRIDAQLEGHRNLAHLVLSWVIHARRPLAVEELLCALAMAQYSTLDRSALHDPEHLTAFCNGLVTIGHEDRTVRLVHYTTQGYFETIRYTRYPNGHKLIAEACLKYIDQFFNSTADTDDEELENDLGTLGSNIAVAEGLGLEVGFSGFHFLMYSLKEWAFHVHYAIGSERDLQDLILLLEDNETALKVCSLSFWGEDTPHYCPNTTLLHIAAAFGFESVVKKLLEQGADVNSTSRKGFTALHYASMTSRPSIARILLDNGANIEAMAAKGRTPLYWGVGYEPIVRLLLDSGASPHSYTQHNETPLSIALAAWEEGDESESDILDMEHPDRGLLLFFNENREQDENKREQSSWNITKMLLHDSSTDYLERLLERPEKEKGPPEKLARRIRSLIAERREHDEQGGGRDGEQDENGIAVDMEHLRIPPDV